MSQTLPPDQAQRERIRTELGINMLVEAAAGSGKTTSMVGRMVGLIEHDACDIGRLAAVTFTRKAAAELRSRFQIELEKVARTPGPRQARLHAALDKLDQCFIGTIHSFCARLLRERPVEAGVDIGFEELDEEADKDYRREAWIEYMDSLFANDAPLLARCRDLGIEPVRLLDSFTRFANFPDIDEWPTRESPAKPDLLPAIERLSSYVEHMRRLGETLPADSGNCKLLAKYKIVPRRFKYAKLEDEPDLMEVFEHFSNADLKPTQKCWPNGREQALKEQERWRIFVQEVAEPLLEQWHVRRYDAILKLFRAAVKVYDERRRKDCVLNYQDLLMKSAALLRSEKGKIRAYFRRRFTHLLVDEFQDTDPIQAEVLLLLTATNEEESDWRKCSPAPGSFFVVGDPKQSIYRFRRADIVTYEVVKKIILAGGGAVAPLTANFRSAQPLIEWVNSVFAQNFPAAATPQSPVYTPMLVGREDRAPGTLAGLRKLIVPKGLNKDELADCEAGLIARTIRRALDSKMTVCRKDAGADPAVNAGDFLIITRNTKNLSRFARKLQELGIPHQVTGGSALNEVLELALLHTCLRAAIAPEDPTALVAALRSELFGISDVSLYRFKKSDGQFSFRSAVPGALEPAESAAFNDAFSRLRHYATWLAALPPVAAIERIVADLGLSALACAVPGGEIHAGSLAKAVELLRSRQAQMWSAAELIDYLGQLVAEEEKHDGLPIRPYDSPVVRVMNLHKAKGLEAPVVFLADASGDFEHGAELHIDRGGNCVRGHMAILTPSGLHGKTLIAHPPDWRRLEAEEQVFLKAENTRLLYVAATRAGDQLIVTQRETYANRNYWRFFDSHLSQAPLLEDPGHPARPAPQTITVNDADVSDARAGIQARWNAAREKTYTVASVKDLTVNAAARAHAAPGPVSAEDAAAWGAVIHLLLQTAALKPEADLHGLAASALLDEQLDAALAPLAVDCVHGVMGSELWKRAQRSPRRLTEVPIQVLEGATLVRGVIDLAFEENGGWVVVDYKTGVAHEDAIANCVALYSGQVCMYARKLSDISGMPVQETGLFMIPIHRYTTIVQN